MVKPPRFLLLIIPLVGYMTFSMFRFSLGVVLPEIQIAFGVGKAEAGFLNSAVFMVSAIVMALIGWLVGKFGLHLTYLMGLGFLSLGLFLISSANSFWLLLLYMMVTGLGVGMIVPAVYVIFGEYLSRLRALMVAIPNAAYGFGGFIGPWLTGKLLGYGWTAPFLIFALFGTLLTTIYWCFFKPHRPKDLAKDRARGEYRKVLRSRGAFVIYSSMLVSNVAFISLITWTPTFLRVVQGLTAEEAGLVFGLFSFAGIIGVISFGVLSDRLRMRRIIASAGGIMSTAVSYVIYSSSYSFTALTALLMLFGFVMYPYWNLQIAMAQESVEPESIGTVTGLIQNAGIVGGVVGPPLVGLLIERIGMSQSLIYGVSTPLLIYAVVVLRWKARPR